MQLKYQIQIHNPSSQQFEYNQHSGLKISQDDLHRDIEISLMFIV